MSPSCRPESPTTSKPTPASLAPGKNSSPASACHRPPMAMLIRIRIPTLPPTDKAYASSPPSGGVIFWRTPKSASSLLRANRPGNNAALFTNCIDIRADRATYIARQVLVFPKFDFVQANGVKSPLDIR